MKKKILITGGAGYIGSQLAKKLIALGNEVVIVDDFSSGDTRNVDKKAKVYKEDICSPAINTIFEEEKPEIIFHLAASKNVNDSLEKPMEFANINILGSINVVNAAHKAGIRKLVFTSTAGVYGDIFTEDGQRENQKENPSSPYAWTKLVIEDYITYMNSYHNMQGMVLRFANVYGHGGLSPYKSVVNIFVEKLFKNESITIHGDGKQTRDFVYIGDLIDVCILLTEKNYKEIEETPLFNVSTGKEITIINLLDLIAKEMKLKPNIQYAKNTFSGQKRSSLNTSKTKRDLGWTAKVNLEEGIKKTIDAYKS